MLGHAFEEWISTKSHSARICRGKAKESLHCKKKRCKKHTSLWNRLKFTENLMVLTSNNSWLYSAVKPWWCFNLFHLFFHARFFFTDNAVNLNFIPLKSMISQFELVVFLFRCKNHPLILGLDMVLLAFDVWYLWLYWKWYVTQFTVCLHAWHEE